MRGSVSQSIMYCFQGGYYLQLQKRFRFYGDVSAFFFHKDSAAGSGTDD